MYTFIYGKHCSNTYTCNKIIQMYGVNTVILATISSSINNSISDKMSNVQFTNTRFPKNAN